MLEKRQKILRQRAEEMALPEQSTEEDRQALAVVEFTLGAEHYAIELRHVREIVPFRELTPLPGVMEAIAGVINLRGEIVALLDLKRLFALPVSAADGNSRILVLRSVDRELAVLADAIIGVRHLSLANTLSSLPTLSGWRQDYLLAITADRLIVLDGGKIVMDPRLVVG
ncbi:chemotaxis protein CheW [Candidatus Magnetaquicoccus inordinatus]|uniref:chemotaxis protein CheW n=1 Tax=Candidatus Magnetaquicoccus inordinatus TaxID=2496818 RepID=UPI00102B73C0|nr:chemotaxis protein CheW [Candidatus Magnetaquicoccus inordinatus]